MTDLPPGFARFWAVYPRRVARAAALKAWHQLGIEADPALQDLMLAALERQKGLPQWTRDSGQYVPHPSTWLRQRRWEDDLEVGVVTKSPLYVVEDPPRPEGSCMAWNTCKGQDAGNGYCLACQVFLPASRRIGPPG